MRRPVLLVCLALMALDCACSKSQVRIATASTPFPADNSYQDLLPGWRLRILVPILAEGAKATALGAVRRQENTVVLSAANLLGYEVSFYRAEKRASGKVLLKFTSAEITRDGHTVPEFRAPQLPFELPRQAQHVRLVFLLRNSNSDHNMAIIAAREVETLASFTDRLKLNPQVCQRGSEVFCIWVPEGIAVRPVSPAGASAR